MNRHLASLALLVLIRSAATIPSSDAALSSWMNRNLKPGKSAGLLPLRGGELQRTVCWETQVHPTQQGKASPNYNKSSFSHAELELGDVIGSGSFSTVHVATRQDGRSVAVKKFCVPERDGERDPVITKRMNREIEIMAALDHPNIAKLEDVFHDSSGAAASIVLERCMGGELKDFVAGFQCFHANGERSWQRSSSSATELVREEHIGVLVRQILLAVEHLHARGVVHRDLKLENVMLQEPFSTRREPRVKLIDFGFSRLQRPEEGLGREMFTPCGSTLYVAPEVLTAQERGVGYGHEVDLWAVGVMAFILLCGRPPFMGPTAKDIGSAIKAGHYAFPEDVWVSAPARDLVRRLLEVNPLQRLSARHALNHPWIRTDPTGPSTRYPGPRTPPQPSHDWVVVQPELEPRALGVCLEQPAAAAFEAALQAQAMVEHCAAQERRYARVLDRHRAQHDATAPRPSQGVASVRTPARQAGPGPQLEPQVRPPLDPGPPAPVSANGPGGTGSSHVQVAAARASGAAGASLSARGGEERVARKLAALEEVCRGRAERLRAALPADAAGGAAGGALGRRRLGGVGPRGEALALLAEVRQIGRAHV